MYRSFRPQHRFHSRGRPVGPDSNRVNTLMNWLVRCLDSVAQQTVDDNNYCHMSPPPAH
jgi:hypothetical protein